MNMNGVLHRIDSILEAFKDIGKLSAKELMRGQKLNPDDSDNFKQVTGRVFHQSVSKIRVNDIARGDNAKGLDTLTVYKVSEYKKMKCYLGKNNSSGYCIAHRDELVSVFSSQQSSGTAIMKSAIKNGAKRLDCFALRNNDKISGDLYKFYSNAGFKIDERKNEGKPYPVVNGVSDYVDDKGNIHPEDERVVIYMKR